jgi:outer membrane lipoprotein-sorting protein
MKRASLALLALTAIASLLAPGSARAANTAPAITAFESAFAQINDYTYQIKSHEARNGATQDRVYQYWFLKPHFAKTNIISGDGAGGGAVWNGGTQVSGHQGGIFSMIHLKLDLHDGRAVSLLGYTLPDGLMQNIVKAYQDTAGTLTQTTATIDGVSTDELDLKVSDPKSYAGVTELKLYLAQDTHWPVHQTVIAGAQTILDQAFSGVKTNTGLTEKDFPF